MDRRIGGHKGRIEGIIYCRLLLLFMAAAIFSRGMMAMIIWYHGGILVLL